MTQEKKHSGTGQDCPKGYKSCDGYRIPKEWHIVRFDSLFSRVTRKNDENNQNVLTISAQQGLISQIEYYNTLYASENKTGYTLLHRGDFSYNKSYSSGYAYGAIKRLDAYEKGIVSPLYLCFTPRQGVNSDFYLQYFEAGCFDREIYKIAQEGARNHGLLNVSTEDFFHSMLVFPPLEEQERITEILTQCDHVIELKEQKLDELKQLKKEFLRKMFPAKGCDTPEIRFPGFTGTWEQRKLGDIGETYTGLSGKTKADFGHGQARFVTYMNVFSNPISNPEMTEPIEIDPKQNEVEVGDVFFTTSSETPEEVGMSSVLLEKRGKTYLNSFCFGFRPSEKIDSYYLAYMLRSESAREKIILLAQGISRYNISKNKVMEIAVSLPSLDEQKLIGQYFRQLDNLITFHQRELEETKTYKKTLARLLLTGIVRVKE